MADCTTIGCENPAIITGLFDIEDDAAQEVTYCIGCARYLWSDGVFKPYVEALVTGEAPPLADWERELVERFDATPPAPESFDAAAACRRVMTLADELERDGERRVATWIRDAVNGVTA